MRLPPAARSLRGALHAIGFALLLAPSSEAGTLVRPFSLSGAAVISTGIEPGQTWGDNDGNESPIPTFDPTLGPLTGWRITLDGDWSIRVRGDAFATAPTDPVSMAFSSGASFQVIARTATGFLTIGALGPFSTPIETCSGVGSCSHTVVDSATGPVSIDSGLLDPALIPPEGLDPQSLLWTLFVRTAVTASGHDSTGWSQLGVSTGAEIRTTGSITYFYTPEPGAAVLVATGLVLLAGAFRRT